MVKNPKIGYNHNGHKKNDTLGIIICLVVFLLLVESILKSRNFAFLTLFLIILIFCIITFIVSYCKKK